MGDDGGRGLAVADIQTTAAGGVGQGRTEKGGGHLGVSMADGFG